MFAINIHKSARLLGVSLPLEEHNCKLPAFFNLERRLRERRNSQARKDYKALTFSGRHETGLS